MASILDGVDLRTQMAGQNRLELLLFKLSSEQSFGINVFKVQEVIQCPKLTQVPGSNPVVVGIASVRGNTIPVIDLGRAIGGPPTDNIESRFIIITEYNRSVQAFLVGSVDRIINMNWEKIMPPPKGAAGTSYLTAVTQVEDKLVEIIDVEKVLKEVNGVNDKISDGVIDGDISIDGIKILVVDDSLVARHQVKSVLDQLELESVLKANGQEALDQLEAWADEYDSVSNYIPLVLSDVEMPQMDGYSLTAAIRKDPRLSDLHVILHTSLSGIFNQSMIEKVGANLFLPKYDPDCLAGAVQERLKNFVAERTKAA